jgi:hypothetical protein
MGANSRAIAFTSTAVASMGRIIPDKQSDASGVIRISLSKDRLSRSSIPVDDVSLLNDQTLPSGLEYDSVSKTLKVLSLEADSPIQVLGVVNGEIVTYEIALESKSTECSTTC